MLRWCDKEEPGRKGTGWMSSRLMMERNRKLLRGGASRVKINAETGLKDANKAGPSIAAGAE